VCPFPKACRFQKKREATGPAGEQLAGEEGCGEKEKEGRRLSMFPIRIGEDITRKKGKKPDLSEGGGDAPTGKGKRNG